MHNKLKATIYFLLFFLTPAITFAAANEPGYSGSTDKIEMADTLRSNGMIYVVVGVILIVLIGLIIYLISVDRKVAKLEKEVDDRLSSTEKTKIDKL